MSSLPPLVDQFQRRITYLRLSVTDRCNLRCSYCMPERQTFLPRAEVLTLEELHRLALGFIDRGITKLRLTGGEPLVRRDMMELVRALGRKVGDGLDELTLTTNGTRLAEFAGGLAAAGVRRINISLDTLDRDVFARLARRDSLPQVLEGIAAAKQAGLQVKLNTVALKGINEGDIPELVAWAHGQGFDLTLIEVMPLGDDRIGPGKAAGLQFQPDHVLQNAEPAFRATGQIQRFNGPRSGKAHLLTGNDAIKIVGGLGASQGITGAGAQRHADADEAACHRNRHDPGMRAEKERLRLIGSPQTIGCMRFPLARELDADHHSGAAQDR